MIYFSDSLVISNDVSFCNSYAEAAMGFVAASNSAYISLYRPPRCPEEKFREALAAIESWLNKLESSNGRFPTIILGGDINFPSMRSWGQRDIELMTANPMARLANDEALGGDKAQILEMIEFVNNFSLTQEVRENTREGNILDVIFTNDPVLIESSEIITNVQISDHNFVIATTNRDTIKNKETKKTNFCSTDIPLYNLKKGSTEDWNKAREDLEDFKYDENLSVDELTTMIQKNLETIVKNRFNLHAPPSKPEGMSKNHIPREVRCILRRKLNTARSLNNTNDESKRVTLKNKIEVLEDQLRKMSHEKRRHIENKATKNLRNNPQEFFSFVKKLSKTSDKVGPFKRNKMNKDHTAAEIISQQYQNVFSKPIPDKNIEDPEEFFNNPDNEDDFQAHRQLETFSINEDEVKKAIDLLPARSAPGPDGIPNLLLKQLKHELAPILSKLFSKSIENGIVPAEFKKALIKPVKKPKKPRSDPASFRPVSLTSGISKIFERIVKPQIQDFLEENNLLCDSQHGFRQRRSCISQLLDHYNEVINDLEDGKISDVIYLDFAKAFDSVDHMILSRELKRIGISGKAGIWIHNFLKNRFQQVIAENKISEPVKMISGVPQGTVLGPVLFLIMINTLSEMDLTSRIKLFADDTRISFGIRNEDDIKTLQDDLDKIFIWKTEHNMKFNSDKFEHVSHGREFRSNIEIPRSSYKTDESVEVKMKKVVRDLGIEISESSEFTDHINLICKRARDKGAWIFRNLYRRDYEFLSFMWRVYVQPIFDYGCQLWSPSTQSDIRKMEDVLRNFTARAQSTNQDEDNYNFWQRISLLNLSSQQRRQERFTIIYIWKIMENLVPNCGLEWESSPRNGRTCIIPRSAKEASTRVKTLRNSSFQIKGPLLFNCVPLEIRNLSNCSINVFKNRLDCLLNTIPDTPLTQKYFPVPMNRITARPSNSIIEWVQFLSIPSRRDESLEIILDNLKRSTTFQDLKHQLNFPMDLQESDSDSRYLEESF